MTIPVNAYTLTVLCGAVLSFVLMVKSLSQRTSTSVGWYAALMAQIFVWSGAYFFELSSHSFSHVLFWSHIEYLGAPFIAPTWLSLVLSYTGKLGKRRSYRYNLIFVIPLISLLLAWTNQYHQLLWREPYFLQQDLFSTLNFIPGIWYIVNFAYAYALFILATIILILSYVKTSPVFRWQIILLLAFSIMNWLANIAYLLGVVPAHYDITPVVFSLSSIPLAFVIFKNTFFSIAPIARDVIMDTVDEPILVLNRDLMLLDFNLEALSFSSLASDEVQGTYAPDSFPAIVTEGILSRMEEIPTEGFEETITCPSHGTSSVYRLKVSPLYGEHTKKQAAGFILIMTDITRLSEYARMLELKNAELDTFARTVAHDIKNPLNTIIGFSSILAEGDVDISSGKQKEMVRAIYEGGLKLDSIVDELFLLSRISTAADLAFVSVDMEAVVSTVLKRLDSLITETGAVIHKPEQWETIESYPPWIEQVWINYISNAAKYGGSPPVIELREKVEGDSIRYSVIDNGTGIREEMMEQLFLPFTRLDKERAEGTGLGLSIVKQILEKLGGAFGMRNRESGGAEFYFTLPGRSR